MVGVPHQWCNGWRAHLESEVDDKMHILANQILKNQKCKMIKWKTNMWFLLLKMYIN
jgi:hypothetical protein